MAKYDVYLIENEYFLDVQANILGDLNSRMIVPLMQINDAPKAAKRLNPTFEIDGQKLLMVTQYMASVPTKVLNQPVTNLSDHFAEITNALDMLFQGF